MPTRRLVHPLTPEKMEEGYSVDSEQCEGCDVPMYLQREYCSLGICVKGEPEDRRGED